MALASSSSPNSRSLPRESISQNDPQEDTRPSQQLSKEQGSQNLEGPDPYTLPGPASPSSSLPSTMSDPDDDDDNLPQLRRGVFLFLELAGEIRNRIYRYSLVFEKSFTVKFRFGISETGLLMVCRQIHIEAVPIFYQENEFRFPQAVFDVDDTLTKLETFFRMPLITVASLKNLYLDIPVCCSLL